MMLVFSGCGKKGDPTIPRKGYDARIEQLTGAWKGEFIELRGELRGVEDPEEARENSRGCRVYYGIYDLNEPPCEGCPVKYHGYHEFGVEVITDEGFACKVPGKVKDGLYFFKVHLIGPDGNLGPASNRTRVK
jgi:hypothetical protein